MTCASRRNQSADEELFALKTQADVTHGGEHKARTEQFSMDSGINDSAATAKVSAGTALIANAPGNGNLWMSAR